MKPTKTTHQVISTRNLSIGYPGKRIAKDLSLHINTGELTAVIGINGSGKSTLLRTFMGDLPIHSGRLLLKGRDLSSYSSKELSEHISIVLSNAPVSQNFSVNEVIALGRHPYTNWLGILNRKDKIHIVNALKQIGIKELGHRKCNELSDGQLQKVFIARALAQDTELIILDEPTNHLDLYHKYFVFKLLKQLVKTTNKAIVFATHELNMALQLCDQLILISNKTAVQGSPNELIEKGYLNKLFPNDLVVFDKTLKNFKLK